MRYEQSRDQSTEFLRQAVAYMGRQQASFDPASYTLWYEHAAGLNPSLSRVLSERLTAQRPLTDADVSRLYTQYIASRELLAIQRVQERLLACLEATSNDLTDTGTHAARFGQRLESQSERLKQDGPSGTLEAVVTELLTETQKMIAVNRTLAQHLETRVCDVESLTARLQQAEADALNDSLTGLLNRRGFEHAAQDFAQPSGHLKNTALLAIDVDGFKAINDTHGHQAGDQVLRAVAHILKNRIKGADIAGRLGGDEFAVLLPDTTVKGAIAVAEQIRAAVAKARLRQVHREDEAIRVSVSVGVAHSGPDDALNALLSSADAALYEAKRSGRNQVRMTATRDSLN